MKPKLTFLCTIVLIAVAAGSALANSAPVVSNVTAAQRADDSKLVDIYYDLADADGDSCTVWVAISDDGGATWRVAIFSVSGHIGPSITPGLNKHVIWDAGADMPGKVGNFKARVFADDGKGPAAMVFVPAGWFPYQNASPGNWIFLPTFAIDKYEVTNQFYCQFLNNADPNGLYWNSSIEIHRTGIPGNYSYTVQQGRENYPVRYVNCYDAEAFAAWRSTLEGVTYRLPTEQQWEKAAAWDPVENHYYTYGYHSDTIDCTRCNYYSCVGKPTPVGYYNGTGGRHDSKSYYGCYDMSGNFWEWTSSIYSGSDRIIRGGAWNDNASYCRSPSRLYYSPGFRYNHIGFRLVLDF